MPVSHPESFDVERPGRGGTILREVEEYETKQIKGHPGWFGDRACMVLFSFAVNTWKVSDLSGDVSLGRGNEQIAAAVGSDISPGDTMKIKEGAWIELVSTGTCEVWELKGNRECTFSEHDIMSSPERDKIPPIHRLAVCFNPGGFSMGKAQRDRGHNRKRGVD